MQQAVDDVARVTGTVAGRTDEIERFLVSLDTFAHDAKGAARDLQTFSKDAKEIPPDVRTAIANLNHRIDDLGDIIKGLKQSFPFSLVVEEKKKTEKK
jgi:ABC-type transporter Mla subunit MlaD